ncbi:MAG: hypothetical protein ACREQ9_01240 [Candidatus Binatia bacterium]
MENDRRVPKRVRLDDTSCQVQATARTVEIDLVDVSPGGACVAVRRAGGVAAHEILDAWLHESPLRLYLEEKQSAVALPVWARGPRPEEQRLLFGLRFVQPIADFGSLMRRLVRS